VDQGRWAGDRAVLDGIIKMEQTRVDDGIWMPERVEVRAAAKIFLTKSFVIDRVLTYSEYRLPQTDVPAIKDPAIP
jgi:hypothetical protein